jgi:hypothetical protein
MMWLGMAAVAAVHISGLIVIRWLAGREERPRRDTAVAIVTATPPGAWVQEFRPDGTTLTVFRRAGASHASIALDPSSPNPSIPEAMHDRTKRTGV